MLTCRICGCNCDPSDLVNGVCDDCRGTQDRQEEIRDMLAQMMSGECEQMELRLEEI